MNVDGETTKYTRYEGTSGKVVISKSIAKALGWEHKDEIKVVFKTVEGNEGLFLFKKKENK